MRLLVITSNSLRHFALISALQDAGHDVKAIVQVPGAPAVTGPAQHAYYERMVKAERTVFPHPSVLAGGDFEVDLEFRALRRQTTVVSDQGWDFDRAVVFGGGLIGGDLLRQCIRLNAVNLHAGIAPQYRGTACNFWAAYDGHPELVGCTLHALTERVDEGPIYRTVHAPEGGDPWRRSMQSVADAIAQVPAALAQREPTLRVRGLIRYSRAADFTEAVAAEFLHRHTTEPTPEEQSERA